MLPHVSTQIIIFKSITNYELESTIPFRVYRLCLLESQAFVDVHIHFVRLTVPMTWVNDRWSDDHVGMVVLVILYWLLKLYF